MTTAQQRRDPVRRRALLQAAATSFAHGGYAHTSVEEIATAGGVTKLIVYRHFESKENLYRAVLEQVFDRQAELFVENLQMGAEGTTEAILTAAREWPDGFRLLWRHAAREPQFAEYASQLREAAVSAARTLVTPFVTKAMLEWAAQTLFDNVIDAVLNWLDYGKPARDEEFIATETAALRATVTAWSSNLR
jgi:AcrR family transcriptional regulator